MAITSPLTITIGGVPHALKRVNQDNNGSTFLKVAANLEIRLTFRHSYESPKADGSQMVRHNVELVQTTYDAAGKADATVAYVVCRSRRGADPIVATNILDALGAFTDAQSASIVDWEN